MKPQLIIFSLGPSHYMPHRGLIDIFTSKILLAFALPSIFLTAMTFEPRFASTGSFYSDLLISLFSGVIFFFMVYIVSFLHLLLSQFWVVPGYAPIAYFIAALCSESAKSAIYVAFGFLPETSPAVVLSTALAVMPFIIVLEQIFIRIFYFKNIEKFEISRIARDIDVPVKHLAPPAAAGAKLLAPPEDAQADQPAEGGSAPAPASTDAPVPRDPAMIQFGGQKFNSMQLRLLEAEEHYIRVFSIHGDTLVKERISLACDAIPEGLGMRVHRSYWLAYCEAQDVVKVGPGKYGIVTADFGTIPLSRNLKGEFRERRSAWLRSAQEKPTAGSLAAET